MGCGESKHVATGNTISRKNSRAGSKRGKTSETIEETRKVDGNKTSSLLVQDQEGKNVNQDFGADNSKAVADGKEDIAESSELKKEENVVEDDKTLAGEETKEETVQEIKLVEDTKEETKKDTVEDKKLDIEDAKDEETVKDQKPAEEKKEETANGEPETVKKENLVKEAETAETTEAEVSIPVEKKEEKPASSPAAEDLKTKSETI